MRRKRTCKRTYSAVSYTHLDVYKRQLLNAARDAGVNYFDTAYPYHGGQSEPFVGRVIAKWPRESFYLATKMPLWQCGHPVFAVLKAAQEAGDTDKVKKYSSLLYAQAQLIEGCLLYTSRCV